MDFNAKMIELADEMDLLMRNKLSPDFCMRKMRAVARKNLPEYCTVLEEELALKAERLQDIERAGELTTGIINNLRGRLVKDEEYLAELQDDFHQQIQEFKKLEAEKGTQDRLIAKLEAENKRQAEELAAAKEEVYLLKKEVDDFVKDYREAGLDPWSDNLPDVMKAKEKEISQLRARMPPGRVIALNNRDRVVDLTH
jgi:chromosome segregation ATPase